MIIKEIRQELRKNADHEYRDSVRKFTKKEDRNDRVIHYGVKTPIVRKVSAKYYSQIKTKPKEEIFSLCEDLLKFRNSEERTIAFDWAFRLREHYIASDFYIFESWLENYVTGWGSCDDLCTHAFGCFIYRFPEFVSSVKKWAKSGNRWMRRASAVVLIYSLRRKQALDSAFGMADILLLDKEDLVQKGYGWMLKEASNLYPQEVFQYVMNHKAEMPRTALRYAIEKMPPEWKKKTMTKE
ncbi:MAG: DNA alkylation repair protein [Methanomicrobia archaeon]|nr:DNA alkylation repair protein [Methanomicrobia archaeon]